MKKDLTLYTVASSRGSMVIWMLEECRADCEIVALDFPALKEAPYLAINPLGKVPALKHRDTVITETLAILTHLAELHPDQQLIPPPGSIERGEYYRWLCYALHLEYAVMDQSRGVHNNEQQQRAIGYGNLDTAFTTLKNHLQNREYLIGDHFTALDLYYSGMLDWFINRIQIISAEPEYSAYMQRHLSRPAFARAQAKEAALTVSTL